MTIKNNYILQFYFKFLKYKYKIFNFIENKSQLHGNIIKQFIKKLKYECYLAIPELKLLLFVIMVDI